tara:strand:+ start:4535 stop:6607 length:2073 start_codon:yes stop_codon:yes gene_type:complete
MQENNNDLWVEKYRPKNINDYLNICKYKQSIESWIQPIINEEKVNKPFLILYGKPGTGKTTLAHCILNHYNFEILECNASIARNKKDLSKIISTGKRSVLFDKNDKNRKIGIIMDELDGLVYGENTGIKTLLEFTFILDNKSKNISVNKFYNIRYPVICTSNSIKERKLKPIIDFGYLIVITPPTINNLTNKCKEIFKNEKFNISNKNLNLLIKHCKQDYRAIINLLYKILISIKTLQNNKLDTGKLIQPNKKNNKNNKQNNKQNNKKNIKKNNKQNDKKNIKQNIKQNNKTNTNNIIDKFKINSKEENNIINNVICNIDYDNNLSNIVNLPIYIIIANIVLNEPKYLEFCKTNNINIKLYNKFRNHYINQINNLINVDNYLFYHNFYENIPNILFPLLDNINKKKNKLDENIKIKKKNKNYNKKDNQKDTQKCNQKDYSNNTLYKDTFMKKSLEITKSIYHNFLQSDILYNKIKSNRLWDMNEYINYIGIIYNIFLLNNLNIKNKKIIKNFNTKYHVKYNTMKQDLGFINNHLLFSVEKNNYLEIINSDNKKDNKHEKSKIKIIKNTNIENTNNTKNTKNNKNYKNKNTENNEITKNKNKENTLIESILKIDNKYDTNYIIKNKFNVTQNIISQDCENYILLKELATYNQNYEIIKNNNFNNLINGKKYISLEKKINKINEYINNIYKK